MVSVTSAPSVSPAAKLSTTELAGMFRVRPQTVRAGYCRQGHYLGLIPTKLPNGHLLWDKGSAENIAVGEVP